MVRNSPTLTGRAGAPGMLPPGAANSPLLAIRIAPCPVPALLMVKIPGANGANVTVDGVLTALPLTTVAQARDWPVSSQGICTFICPAELKNRGAEKVPLNSMLLPPSEMGSGNAEATVVDAARPVPKAAAILPGTTPKPAWNPPAFTAPPEGNTGTVAPELMVKGTLAEVPPRGVGLATVTCAVAEATKSAAETPTLSWPSLMNAVVRLIPFQRTVEPGTNFLPNPLRTQA